jgi:hypothetical protein
MFKKVFLIAVVLGLTSGCVSVRFPNELNVRLTFPEHMSSGDMDHFISRFPSRIEHPKGSMKVHVFKDKDSIKFGAKEFLFISDDGKVIKKNDSTKVVVIKENN